MVKKPGILPWKDRLEPLNNNLIDKGRKVWWMRQQLKSYKFN